MPMASPRPGRRPAGGFTLLEVLAAVLVLGLLYTMLANVAIDGLRSEGESKRRLGASLVADRVLADIESQLDSGAVPPLGSSEEQEDPYQIDVSVTPLELPFDLVPPNAEPGTKFEPLVLGGDTPQDNRLRSIEVRVTWDELDRELSVVRTTYAFDASGLDAVLGTGTPGSDTGATPGAAASGEGGPNAPRSTPGSPSGGGEPPPSLRNIQQLKGAL
jgi:prepilin-type N-terminal cleavage/methylation domain-containing protein